MEQGWRVFTVRLEAQGDRFEPAVEDPNVMK